MFAYYLYSCKSPGNGSKSDWHMSVNPRMVIYWPKHVVLSIVVLNTFDSKVLCLTVHNICYVNNVCYNIFYLYVFVGTLYDINGYKFLLLQSQLTLFSTQKMYYCYICYDLHAGIDSYIPETNRIYSVQSFAAVLLLLLLLFLILL